MPDKRGEKPRGASNNLDPLLYPGLKYDSQRTNLITSHFESFSQNFPEDKPTSISLALKVKPFASGVFTVLAAFSFFVSLWYGFFLALTQVNR